MIDRRELLKYFGIGATITPVVGGSPIIEAAAQLVKEPELRPLVITSDFPHGHEPSEWKHRLKWNTHEAVWLLCWQIANDPWSGEGVLRHVLKREPNANEKAAVAAVIQWFGSNIGFGFIWEVMQELGYHISDSANGARSERSALLNKLQSSNIWGDRFGNPLSGPITFDYRGRTILLEPNAMPKVRRLGE